MAETGWVKLRAQLSAPLSVAAPALFVKPILPAQPEAANWPLRAVLSGFPLRCWLDAFRSEGCHDYAGEREEVHQEAATVRWRLWS